MRRKDGQIKAGLDKPHKKICQSLAILRIVKYTHWVYNIDTTKGDSQKMKGKHHEELEKGIDQEDGEKR